LRGLSTETSTKALADLFAKGVLTLEDLHRCDGSFLKELSIAALWALSATGSRVTLTMVRQHLVHLPLREVAVLCFSCGVFQHIDDGATTPESLQKWVADWLNVFPEGREWVTFLLLPAFDDAAQRIGWITANVRHLIGPIFWAWRGEAVAKDWLLGSDDCVFFMRREKVDLLRVSLESLRRNVAAFWGITPEQQADLVAWCERMIQQREELKEKGKK
jgi:hypothetical protein